MILTFTVGPFCTGGGENHATVTITGGPVSVPIRVSRRTLRDPPGEADFKPFARVLLYLLADTTVPGTLTKAALTNFDGKSFKIDVSELT